MAHHRVTLLMAQLVVVLWAANMVQLGLRYSWGIALPNAAPELGLNGLQAGAVASAFYIGYVVTGIPAGLLVDTLGSKRATTLSLISVGLVSFAIASSKSFTQIFAAFLAAGILAGPIFPSSLKTLSEALSTGSRGTGVGALETVSPAAMILAATVFPTIIAGFGWRQVYVALGIAALIVCLAYNLKVPATSNISAGEKKRVSLGSTLANPQLIWAVAVRLGGMWGIIGVSAWFYYFAITLVGALGAQILYLILASAAVVGQLVGGVAADKYGRLGVAAAGMACFGVAMALFALLRGVLVAYILAPLIGFSAFFWKSGLDTHILESAPHHQRGSAAGFMNTVSQLGSLIAPAAVGYAVDMAGALSPIPILILAVGPIAAALPLIAITLINSGRMEAY
ncbi:MAG: MFS transporter [Thermoprotei archaeon]